MGFEADGAEAVFGHYVQSRSEAAAGVAGGGAWLVFGTQHGDYEPARAFDRRYVDGAGEYEVGWYHQDDVAEEDYGDTSLPQAYPSYAQWFDAAVTEAGAALGDEEARASFEDQQTRMLARREPSPHDPSRWRDLSFWAPNNLRTYARWLRESDADLAADIVDRIDRDVRGQGPRDPKFDRALVSLDRGAWPYQYPKPAPTSWPPR